MWPYVVANNEGLANRHLQLLHLGEPLERPSLPINLHSATSDDNITITWDPPMKIGGNRIAISLYKIRIPELLYSVEEESTIHSHTIIANGSYVMFNMPYVIQVVAINTCKDVSDPTNITITVEASGKHMHICIGSYMNMHCIHTYYNFVQFMAG